LSKPLPLRYLLGMSKAQVFTWYQSTFLWQWWAFPSCCWTRVWPKMPHVRERVKVSHIAKRSLSCRLYKPWTPLLSQDVFWGWVRPMNFYNIHFCSTFFFLSQGLSISLIKDHEHKALTLQSISLCKIIATCYEVTYS
jgi:hypothetical protein